MPSEPDPVRAYFERCADRFDGFYRDEKRAPFDRLAHAVFRRPGLARRFKATARILGDVAGAKILDVGCGSGIYAVYFAKRGAEVTGIDFSDPMLDLARRNAEEEGCRIRFIRGDFLRQALEPGYDHVLMIGIFDYVEAKDRPTYLERASPLFSRTIVATFPKRYTPQTPIRYLWLRNQGCPVHFCTGREIHALARDAGLGAKLHNCGPIWTVSFTKPPQG